MVYFEKSNQSESVLMSLKLIFLFLSFHIYLFATEASQCIHLLNRTSFGVDQQHLTSCLEKNSYEDTVKELIYKPGKIGKEEKPLCAQKLLKPPRKMRDLNSAERKVFRQKRRENMMALKIWWFEKMLKTDDPFLERMTLFWHNHFTSSLKKVKQSALMYRQNQLFRKYALGNFSELLHAIIEDPAMLIYLDNRANKKGHPNENLAREFLELFSLGEGNYSEDDIKELARALTGYSVDKELKFRFKKRVHDKNKKEIFGQSGNFDAHEMIDIILQQKATSLFIVEKLWSAFIGYDPNPKEVQRLAQIFRENSYELKPLMQALLTSVYFTDPSVRGTMIKSPIELIVGTLRSFNYYGFDPKTGVQYARRLGQDLFDPPNVKGWRGGKTWINTNTLLIRRGFLNRLTRGNAMKDLKYGLFESSTGIESREERAAETLLPVKVFITPAPKFNQTLRTILQHPLYQLK